MAEKSKLMMELEKRRLELSITKASTAKEELDMKIIECQVNIERMEEHKSLQDEVIANAKEELASYGNG